MFDHQTVQGVCSGHNGRVHATDAHLNHHVMAAKGCMAAQPLSA
jgi:hypothetical protein